MGGNYLQITLLSLSSVDSNLDFIIKFARQAKRTSSIKSFMFLLVKAFPIYDIYLFASTHSSGNMAENVLQVPESLWSLISTPEFQILRCPNLNKHPIRERKSCHGEWTRVLKTQVYLRLSLFFLSFSLSFGKTQKRPEIEAPLDV